MQSIAKKVAVLTGLPAFTAASLYMHKTHMQDIVLPPALKAYEPVIDHMLDSLSDRNQVCYVTIDEKLVSGTTHRRAGVHVDHNWYEDLTSHSGHRNSPGMHGNGGHSAGGSWNNPAPNRWRSTPAWYSSPGHNPGRTGGGHNQLAMDEFNGGMLLASNYPACKVWTGEFTGTIKEGGDCSDIVLTDLYSEIMPAGDVYYLNPLGIHESLPIADTVERQLVRINFHPDYIPAL